MRTVLLACLLVGFLTSCASHQATRSSDALPTTTYTFVPTITDARTGQVVEGVVFVDSMQCGTPCLILADQQRHVIRIEAAGYKPWQVSIAANLKAGRHLRLPIQLTPRMLREA